MISVIIPTFNAENSIHQLLASLREQSIDSEVIVIDSSSSDDTVKAAKSYGAKIIQIKKKDFDHGGTRNLAVSHSRGSIIVFLTQDALPEDKLCLENLVKPLEKAEIAAAYGRQISGTNATPAEKFARLFNYPLTPLLKGQDSISKLGIKTFFFSNACSAIRKSEFEEVRGFPEKVIMNEDMVLAAKLILRGYKIAYAPDAKIIHSHNYGWKQQFKRYFDIGVSLRDHQWILQYANADKEGAKFLKEEVSHLLQNRAYKWVPYIIGEALSKYLGYNLGLNYALLPKPLIKKLSMHSSHWS